MASKPRRRGLTLSRFELGGERYIVLAHDLSGPDGPRVLTAAEQRVFARLLDGASNAAIARSLGRSPRTIANHVAAIFRKLDVSSRSELVARLAAAPTER